MLDQVGPERKDKENQFISSLSVSEGRVTNQDYSGAPHSTETPPKGKRHVVGHPKIHPNKRRTESINRDDLDVRFDVCWEDTVLSKQTLFPVYNLFMQPPVPQRGAPPEGVSFTLRATKRVNMHPFPTLTISHKRDGTPWKRDEDIKISLVEKQKETDTVVNPQNHFSNVEKTEETELSTEEGEGGCPCKSQGIIAESQEYQIRNDGFSRVENGRISFKKLQIGCVTSVRGHGVPFQIKIEFIHPKSPLFGHVVYSTPIEVGAKSPFALVYMKGKSSKQWNNQTHSIITELCSRPASVCQGEERMRILVARYGLQHFLDVFLRQEVDEIAFECLTEESLREMGITHLCDQFFILQAVHHYLASNNLRVADPSH